MLTLELEICIGLPEQHRRQAAELVYSGFRTKLAPIMGAPDRVVAILEESLAADMALVALCEDQLVGLAGVGYNGRGFMNLHLSGFVRRLGWLHGLPGYVLAWNYARPAPAGKLALECLVVADSMRGQGIGTQLLDTVFDLARTEQLDSVQLDVVDTNPRARTLYERAGFTPIRTRSYPFCRRLLGLSAVTTMQKHV